MRSILHVLPHRGGGGEEMFDMLAGLEGLQHDRCELSPTREPGRALPSIVARWPGIARRARRYDLIHAHGDVVAILILPLLRRRPSVWYSHGLHLLRRMSGARLRVVRAALRAVVSATNRTICSSEAEREDLAELVAPSLRDRLVVVHNGVGLPPPAAPDESARVRRELGVSDDETLCLYLGQLEERKDPGTLVEAVESATDAGLVLALAGEGPLLEPLRARQSPAVRVLGYRDDPQRLLAAADVFVMPSTREGLSLAVLRAMSHSVAVVVSDGPGNPEAVGDAGIVFPASDSAALARVLTALARDPGERERLGRAARARIEGHFRKEHFLAGMAHVYEDVLAETERG
jgi:glycosyltransferase involved in cell wall biosynthesis